MGALDGVLLVDFGQYLAGPFGPMIIGDLGAEVIKVEPVTVTPTAAIRSA